MIYTWQCRNGECNAVVEVHRSLADIEVGPDGACERCDCLSFKRIMAPWQKHQSILVFGGKAPWFAEQYYGPNKIPTGR